MGRRAARLALVALLVPFAACSWITAFAVSNRSADPIRVELHFAGVRAPEPCPFAESHSLALASTETMGWWRPRADWRPLPPASSDLELVLTSRSGTLALSGVELVRAFERRTDALYELAYTARAFGG